MNSTDTFLAAKQWLRARPSLQRRPVDVLVVLVAEGIGVTDRDTRGLTAIREAIKDTQAGGFEPQHLRT